MRQLIRGSLSICLFFRLFCESLLCTASPPVDQPRLERAGRWAATFQALGDIPLNSKMRDNFKSGLGVGGRAGYSFWEGLSVEIDFQYDLMFKEGGSHKIKENKNLLSLSPGLRYTLGVGNDIAWYSLALLGVTFDYTRDVTSAFNMSYAIGTGIDFGITENLSFGPIFQFRHVLEDEQDEGEMKIQWVGFGVSVTYLYD